MSVDFLSAVKVGLLNKWGRVILTPFSRQTDFRFQNLNRKLHEYMTVNGAGWTRAWTKHIYEPLRPVSYNWFRIYKRRHITVCFQVTWSSICTESGQYMILFEDLNSSKCSCCLWGLARGLARFVCQTGNGGQSRDSWRVQKRTLCTSDASIKLYRVHIEKQHSRQ